MPSLKRHEGYLLIDNSNGPGVSEEFVRASGRPAVAVPEGKKGEYPTLTCSHCQRIVVLNPLRRRERAYCAKCDHYLCDVCGIEAAQTKECRLFRAMLDKQQEEALRRAGGG